MRSSIAISWLAATRWTNTSVSLSLWKIEPASLELGAQLLGVREVAVVADGERAARVVDGDGLGVLDVRAARRRVADVADGEAPGQLAELVLGEGVLHQAHGPVGVELLAVARDDAGRLLPAVLERVQPEVRHVGRLGVPVDAEDATHGGRNVAVTGLRGQGSRGRSAARSRAAVGRGDGNLVAGMLVIDPVERHARQRAADGRGARAQGLLVVHRAASARQAHPHLVARKADVRDVLDGPTVPLEPPPACTQVAAWLMASARAFSTGASRSQASGAVRFDPLSWQASTRGSVMATPEAAPASTVDTAPRMAAPASPCDVPADAEAAAVSSAGTSVLRGRRHM